MLLEQCKHALRQHMRRVRASLATPDAGMALARHVLHSGLLPPGVLVAGFWPIGSEIDTRPLLHGLHHAGYQVLLPQVPEPGQEPGQEPDNTLLYRRWHPDRGVIAGRFGTFHADGAMDIPAVLLVPLLAFDRQGRRLGYGGGFYDRSLAALPGCRAIGCAYAGQETVCVPTAAHDMPLCAIATETGVIRCGAA